MSEPAPAPAAAAATSDPDAFEQLAAWLAESKSRRAWIELADPIGRPATIKVTGYRYANGEGESVTGSYELNAGAPSFGRAWDLLSEQLHALGTP